MKIKHSEAWLKEHTTIWVTRGTVLRIKLHLNPEKKLGTPDRLINALIDAKEEKERGK